MGKFLLQLLYSMCDINCEFSIFSKVTLTRGQDGRDRDGTADRSTNKHQPIIWSLHHPGDFICSETVVSPGRGRRWPAGWGGSPWRICPTCLRGRPAVRHLGDMWQVVTMATNDHIQPRRRGGNQLVNLMFHSTNTDMMLLHQTEHEALSRNNKDRGVKWAVMITW